MMGISLIQPAVLMGIWTFYSINRLEQVLLRCLISWLSHPGYTGVHQTMRTILVLLWVGGCEGLFNCSIQFFFLPKQRMGQRSRLRQEKTQSTASPGAMLPETFFVIWHPSVFRRKCLLVVHVYMCLCCLCVLNISKPATCGRYCG